MVLSRVAVREFLDRRLSDSVAAKWVDDGDLDRLLARAGTTFRTSPRRAQKVCSLLGLKYDRYLFLLGMGAGKSKLSIDLFAARRSAGEAERMLVLVPNVVNLGSWLEEFRKHAPEGTRVGVLDAAGAAARRAVLLDRGLDAVVATYQGFAVLCSGKEEGVSGRRSLRVDKDATDELASAFEFLVLDECTAVRNHASLWHKVCRRAARSVRFLYGLTGTPFDKDPMDLWAQFFLVDGGWSLGETLGLYRAAFFREKQGWFGGFEYEFRADQKQVLARRLRHRSVRYHEEECQDLPPAVGGLSAPDWMLRPVALSKEQRPYYETAARELRLAAKRGDYETVDSAYLRTRMVSSGWLGLVGEDGDRVELEFAANPKLDAAVALLGEVPEGEKVVLVCWFRHTVELVRRRLDEEGVACAVVHGPTRDKEGELRRWQEPGGPRVLVASTAISKGVNLQAAARFMVFLESPDSSIERRQMEARVRREGGLSGPRYYYDVVARPAVDRPGVDERVLASLRSGASLHEALVEGGV